MYSMTNLVSTLPFATSGLDEMNESKIIEVEYVYA